MGSSGWGPGCSELPKRLSVPVDVANPDPKISPNYCKLFVFWNSWPSARFRHFDKGDRHSVDIEETGMWKDFSKTWPNDRLKSLSSITKPDDLEFDESTILRFSVFLRVCCLFLFLFPLLIFLFFSRCFFLSRLLNGFPLERFARTRSSTSPSATSSSARAWAVGPNWTAKQSKSLGPKSWERQKSGLVRKGVI